LNLHRSLRQALWIAAAATLAITLFLGSRSDGRPRTAEARVEALSEVFACPECSGQSVAQSTAPAALNIRAAIAQMVDEGRTDGEIRALIADRFQERVLLVPDGDGVVGLVWAVPVAVGVVAGAALVVVFRRWRQPLARPATDDDRDLVARFLAERDELTGTR
jgi:cytochrome c-type biogenesis protein CcmH